MTSSNDVAQYFIWRCNSENISISNLKLQKLLYYAQGFHLAISDIALFRDRISAWDHGPVQKECYYRYRNNGSQNIPSTLAAANDDVFSKEELNTLNLVFETQAHKQAWELRKQSHKEPTWLKYSIDDDNATGEEITKDEMKAYFITKITGEDYFNSFKKSIEAVQSDDDWVEIPNSLSSVDDFMDWIDSPH